MQQLGAILYIFFFMVRERQLEYQKKKIRGETSFRPTKKGCLVHPFLVMFLNCEEL